MSMKKFIISTLAIVFGLVFFAPTAFAGGFNDASGDFPTVLVANDTQNPCGPSYSIGCWNTTVSANPGDVISVQVFYHNTTNVTAPNVTIGLGPKNANATTSRTFYGGVAVNGSLAAQGSALVRTYDAQTLTFIPGSVKWYPNASGTRALLANEDTLFTAGGLPVGNIPGNTQGVVVASFRVSNNSTGGGGGNGGGDNNCNINSFTADEIGRAHV